MVLFIVSSANWGKRYRERINFDWKFTNDQLSGAETPIIDWNDHWKTFSYYIHSLFTDKPMVHIASFNPGSEQQQYWNEAQLRYQPLFSHWNWQGRDTVSLYTFSNCQEVELFLNGRSIGVKQVPELYYTKDVRAYAAEEYNPDKPINVAPAMHSQLEWKVPYEPGVNEAVSRIDGKEVARHKIQTAGVPHRIVLEADREVINADGLDLSYVTVKVVDKDGVLVPDANHNITFSVTGEGTNAGVGNADMISHKPLVANQRKAFQGKALLIVRSDRK